MRLLIIAASDPYTDLRAQELLDALLVAATFGAEVSLLFQETGVVQLLPNQAADRLGRRSLSRQLDALALFDVERVYVDAQTLAALSLSVDDFAIPVIALQPREMSLLLAEHDQVIRT